MEVQHKDIHGLRWLLCLRPWPSPGRRPDRVLTITRREEDRLTLKRLKQLTGETPLANRRDEETRRLVFQLGRVTYEQGRLDALDEIRRIVD